MVHLTDRINAGEASWEDVELLQSVASQIKDKCFCALGEFSIEAVLSGIERFPEDFQQRTAAAPNFAGALAQLRRFRCIGERSQNNLHGFCPGDNPF